MQWDLNVLQPDPTMKKPTLVYNISGMGLKYGFVLENSGVILVCVLFWFMKDIKMKLFFQGCKDCQGNLMKSRYEYKCLKMLLVHQSSKVL